MNAPSGQPQPRVGVVVVNYNGGDVTLRCLDSLTTLTPAPYRVYLVDNGSDDGVVAACAHRGVDLIQTGANVGYTGGNNAGLRAVIESGCDYALVLNHDTTVINPEFLGRLVSIAEADPQIGVLGPLVYLRDTATVQNTCCRMPGGLEQIRRWTMQRRGGTPHAETTPTACEPELLNGVCLLMRCTCLESVGLFDPRIFGYREDTDLALRLRKTIWTLRFEPVPSVVHHQALEGYDYAGLAHFLLKRNAVYVLRKHGRGGTAALHAVTGLALAAARSATATLRGSPDAPALRTACRRLARALWAIYTQRLDTPAFGPPNAPWRPATSERS